MTMMKTTLEIPDELFREAKAKAALEGRKLKDLVAEGLRAVISGQTTASPRQRRVTFPILKAKGKVLTLTDELIAEVEAREESEIYGRLMRR